MIAFVSWHEAKRFIDEIYCENVAMSPYQCSDFMNITKRGMADKNPFLSFSMREINIFKKDDTGKVKLAAFFLYSKNSDGLYNVYFRGQLTSAGHLDFIYREKEYFYEDFCEIMDALINRLNRCVIHLNKIPEKSKTNGFIEKKFGKVSTKRIESCVTIPIPENYESYFAKLKKSTRQNLRTAYNRMERENIKFEFVFYENKPIKKADFKKMLALYAKRLAQYNGINGENFKKRILLKALYFIKKVNPMTKALCKMKNACYGYILLNEEMAACFWGLSANDGRIIVPRLSVDTKYSVYCPGGLLITETIKKLTGEFGDKYTQFDLSCGDEPYKYTYGGVPHYNCAYDIYPLGIDSIN